MINFPKIGDPVLDPSDKHYENGAATNDLLLADGAEVFYDSHPLYAETRPDMSDILTYPGRQVMLAGGYANNENVQFGETQYVTDGEYRLGRTRDKGVGAFNLSASTSVDPVWDLQIPVGLATAEHVIAGGSYWHSEYSMLAYVEYLDVVGNPVFSLKLYDSETTPGTIAKTFTEYRIGTGPWQMSALTGGFASVATIGLEDGLVRYTGHANAAVADFTAVCDTSAITHVRSRGTCSLNGFVSASKTFAAVSVEVAVRKTFTPLMTSPDPSCPWRGVADLTGA